MKLRTINGITPIVGVLMERYIQHQAAWWLIGLAQQGLPFVQMAHGRTDVVRNHMAKHLLENEQFTHLLMLDIDHEHPDDIAARLCARAGEDRDGRPILAALCYRGSEPFEPLAFRRDAEGLYQPVLEWAPGELLSVDACGTGAMLIDRRVFETLPGPPWFWYDYDHAADWHWPTEDVQFCKLARQHGYAIHVDTAVTSDHLRLSRINGDVFTAFVQHNREVQENGK